MTPQASETPSPRIEETPDGVALDVPGAARIVLTPEAAEACAERLLAAARNARPPELYQKPLG